MCGHFSTLFSVLYWSFCGFLGRGGRGGISDGGRWVDSRVGGEQLEWRGGQGGLWCWGRRCRDLWYSEGCRDLWCGVGFRDLWCGEGFMQGLVVLGRESQGVT